MYFIWLLSNISSKPHTIYIFVKANRVTIWYKIFLFQLFRMVMLDDEKFNKLLKNRLTGINFGPPWPLPKMLFFKFTNFWLPIKDIELQQYNAWVHVGNLVASWQKTSLQRALLYNVIWNSLMITRSENVPSNNKGKYNSWFAESNILFTF